MADFGSMSADQINASMGFGPGGVGDQSQALFNNLYGPMGFGGQTDYYSALGAAYGRETGGFGGTINGGSFWDGSRGYPSGTVEGPYSMPDVNNPYGLPYDQPQQPQQPAYDYTSLYGGGAAATPPSAYNYGSLGGGGANSDIPADLLARMSPSDISQFRTALARGQPSAPTLPDPNRLLGYDPSNSARAGGTSDAPPYQGNPYYLPDPMQAQQPIQQGGGFGAPGFGPYGGPTYTGQPGYGLGIGAVGGPVSMPPAFGTSGGGASYGYGGLPAGMSASDWNIFSQAVGPQAAQAWAAQQGGAMGSTFDQASYQPAGMSTGNRGYPIDMTQEDFKLQQYYQNNPNTYNMPILDSTAYGGRNAYNMPTSEPSPTSIDNMFPGTVDYPRLQIGGGPYQPLRQSMSPQDLQTFQHNVSPEEFQQFMK